MPFIFLHQQWHWISVPLPASWFIFSKMLYILQWTSEINYSLTFLLQAIAKLPSKRQCPSQLGYGVASWFITIDIINHKFLNLNGEWACCEHNREEDQTFDITKDPIFKLLVWIGCWIALTFIPIPIHKLGQVSFEYCWSLSVYLCFLK